MRLFVLLSDTPAVPNRPFLGTTFGVQASDLCSSGVRTLERWSAVGWVLALDHGVRLAIDRVE